MDFGLLPPEINSGRMYAGPGSGPMLAAATAWDALADELELAATGYASSVSELTGSAWSGAASTAMAGAALPYVAWLQTTSALAEQSAVQAKSAAAAYEAAFAATVPPPVIAANRALLAALVATNFFGQNTAAIMAAEAHYAEMWAQDAAAMYGYAGASSSASTLTSFQSPPPTTNPIGLSGQAGAVAQAASTAAHAQDLLPLTGTLHELVSPAGSSSTSGTSTTTGTSGLMEFLNGYNTLLGGYNGDATSVMSTNLGWFTASYTVFANGLGYVREFAVRGGIAGYTTFDALGPVNTLFGTGAGGQALGGLGNAAFLGPSAAVGQASAIGKLSVPPSWATVSAGPKPVAVSLTASSASAVEAVPPGMAMDEAMMGTMSGRGAVSGVADSRDGKDSRGDKNQKTRDEKDGERPVAALVMASGWLASTLAYNSRRRVDPDPLPLPPDWQEELAANQSTWG